MNMKKDIMSSFQFDKRPVSATTFSYKVKAAMKRDGRKYTWLSKQLGINRVAMYDKLQDNSWTLQEINLLKRLLNLG
jgi:hypothetical protein